MLNRSRVIPTILIENDHLVKTVKFSDSRYIGDPINAVRIFNDLEVDELCILDITASKHGRDPNYGLISNIASEAFMPLAYGGGISSMDQARKIFKAGYEKIVLNTALYKTPQFVKEVAEYAGRQSVVASIDVSKTLFGKYKCHSHSGTIKNKMIDPVDQAKEAELLGAGEIFLNSVPLDGLMKGYDLTLIKQISGSIGIPVIACGGAGSIGDLKKALDAGADAVAAGSLFVYFGRNKAVLINSPTEEEYITSGIYTLFSEDFRH